jgi:hypothetical protein
MPIRKLDPNEVTFSIDVQLDDTPFHGNAIASGDAYFDKQVENEIIRRLNKGDIWAWACVKVTAEWNGFCGSDILGGCNYESEADFLADSYYEQMKACALADLQNNIENIAARIAKLS